ncbi:MAG TPA: FUSC family protein [Oleiagrimonas sp.]|nr:FUSC family protein [Oleiagrimonas sp.]
MPPSRESTPAGAYSLRSTLIDTLIGWKRPDVPVMVAIRNTVAVVLPMGIGFATGHPVIGLGVSTGALEVMFADRPGPYRQRLQIILLVSLAAALSGLVGFLVGGHFAWSVLALAVWGFLGGMLVLFGPNMARVGMTSMILLIVTSATPLPWRQALGASGLILAGGLLQALFSIAAWPLQRYRPERFALASVYRDLARQARRQPHRDDAPPVVETLTHLQHTLLGRTHTHRRAMESFHVLLGLAERMRLEWIALAEESVDSTAEAMFRRDAARVLDAIAEALEDGERPTQARRCIKLLETSMEPPVSGTRSRPDGPLRHMRALTGQLAAAVRNANWAGSRGEIRAHAADTSLPRALRNIAPMAAVRANLNLSSTAFRHSLRCAGVLALALIVAYVADLGRGYWLPMTAAIVLKPDFSATFNAGLLRVLGTLLGLVVVSVLLHLTPESVWAHLLLMAVLCFGFRYLASAHYGIAVTALTGTVVILLSFSGYPAGPSLDERVLNTVLGSALAMLVYMLWPTWERGYTRTMLANMLEAYSGYLRALVTGNDASTRRDARASARAARSNARASVDRLRAEPRTPTELVQLSTSLLANGNRLVRTSMALEALLDEEGNLPCGDATDEFLDAACTALQQIVTGVRESREPDDFPSLRPLQLALTERLRQSPDDDDAPASMLKLSDRLTDNINTLAHVLGKALPADENDENAPGAPHPDMPPV